MRIGELTMITTAHVAAGSRMITPRDGGWFLSLRHRVEVGPYPTVSVAMTAAQDLEARLHDLKNSAADRVVQAFVLEQRQVLAAG